MIKAPSQSKLLAQSYVFLKIHPLKDHIIIRIAIWLSCLAMCLPHMSPHLLTIHYIVASPYKFFILVQLQKFPSALVCLYINDPTYQNENMGITLQYNDIALNPPNVDITLI